MHLTRLSAALRREPFRFSYNPLHASPTSGEQLRTSVKLSKRSDTIMQ
jgi:hypothetical protein